MNFEHSCTVPVARKTLWDFLMDVPQMAACIPGVSEVVATGEDQYAGRMKITFGPIRLTLQGELRIQELDQTNWRAVGRAEANDRRIGGGVHISAALTLVEQEEAQTQLSIQTEARLMGKLGEFGQPVIRKRADKIVAEFAWNVAKHFSACLAIGLDAGR